MHLVGQAETWDAFPSSRRHDDTVDRRDANRAIGVSAVGLAVTGSIELVIALLSGSVGLLGDALHNLSDVSTSAVVFVGLHGLQTPGRCRLTPTATSGPRTWPGSAWPW